MRKQGFTPYDLAFYDLTFLRFTILRFTFHVLCVNPLLDESRDRINRFKIFRHQFVFINF